MSTLFSGGVVLAAESASSTTSTMSTAWPYVAVSVLVTLSLVGTALKILRNQNAGQNLPKDRTNSDISS